MSEYGQPEQYRAPQWASGLSVVPKTRIPVRATLCIHSTGQADTLSNAFLYKATKLAFLFLVPPASVFVVVVNISVNHVAYLVV